MSGGVQTITLPFTPRRRVGIFGIIFGCKVPVAGQTTSGGNEPENRNMALWAYLPFVIMTLSGRFRLCSLHYSILTHSFVEVK